MNEECCNYDCNQGRDCPRRNKRNLSKEITEGFKALEATRNSVELDTRSYLIGRYDTSPVKELTDEEIQEVIDDPQFECVFDLEDFARAILRKAQEK
jgi:hypothetical protein